MEFQSVWGLKFPPFPFWEVAWLFKAWPYVAMRISDMVYELNNRQQQQQASVQQHQQQNAAQDEKVPHSEGPGSLEKAFCGMKLQKISENDGITSTGFDPRKKKRRAWRTTKKDKKGLTNNKKGCQPLSSLKRIANAFQDFRH